MMNKVVYAVLALVMVVCSTVRAQEEEFSEVEYYKKLAEKQLAEAQAEPVPEPEPAPAPTPAPVYYYEPVTYYVEEEPAPPANLIVVTPQYYHSRNDEAKFEVGGQKLKMAKSRANGAGVSLVYNRRITDWFSLAFTYQHTFMKVNGGMAVPAVVDAPAKEDVRWHSNVVGVIPEFTIPTVGKLQLSLIQGFDRASGHERIGDQLRDVDDYGTDVTSLMAWWEKDFTLGCEGKWKITPYAGWRSLYVKVRDANVWDAAPGVKSDDNLWVHLVSGGLKVSFQNGPLGMSLRGGVNHRTTRDDIPGYGNRAVAPGVVNFSHRANLDRTVGSVGANINYVINKRAIIGVGYDGMFGKDTSAHMGSLNFIFPF